MMEAGWSVGQIELQGSVLVGSQKSTEGGNIFTEAEYDNFELRFNYRVDWPPTAASG